MKKRILFVTTNFSKINENIKTGVWFEEFAVPFLVFEKTGYELVVASPLGGNSPIDVNSLSWSYRHKPPERQTAVLRQSPASCNLSAPQPTQAPSCPYP